MSTLKQWLKLRAPVLSRAIREARIRFSSFRSTGRVFHKIYVRNFWEHEDSRSGPGSSLEQTRLLRPQLQAVFAQLGVESILDIPCGDYHWMKELTGRPRTYIGADVVEEIISENQCRYGEEGVAFVRLDILRDRLPTVDLIFCRDLLVHFNLAQIQRAILAIKQSKSNFLLTTTFPGISQNENIVTGEWRPLDMTLPPFNFPPPHELIIEGFGKSGTLLGSKSLGLWRISEL